MATWLSIKKKTLPSWALRLLIGTLLLPPLIVVADGLARARRRRLAVARWSLWTLLCAAPFLLAALFAMLLGAIGVIGAAPGELPPPAGLSFGSSQLATVLAVLLALALAWLLWPMLLRPGGVRARPHGEA